MATWYNPNHNLFFINYYWARQLEWKKPGEDFSISFFNQLLGSLRNWKKPAMPFPIIIFPIINYSRILERDSNDTFSMIFPAQWEKTGVNFQLFFSITTNYNYFRILGLGDKEPTFFSFQQQLIIATRL